MSDEMIDGQAAGHKCGEKVLYGRCLECGKGDSRPDVAAADLDELAEELLEHAPVVIPDQDPELFEREPEADGE